MTFLFLAYYIVLHLFQYHLHASVTQAGKPASPFFNLSNDVIHDYYRGNIDDVFQNHASEDIIILFLYAPWDEECQNSRKTIQEIAHLLKDQIPVVAVNCWHGSLHCRGKGLVLFRYPQLLIRVRFNSPSRVDFHPEHVLLQYEGPIHSMDHVLAFVNRVLLPYQFIHSTDKLASLAAEYDNVLIGVFNFAEERSHARQFRHFYESSLLSLDRRYYFHSATPFHLVFAIISRCNVSSLLPDTVQQRNNVTHWPDGTLLLLRSVNRSMVLHSYEHRENILRFLELHGQTNHIHRVYTSGVKSAHLKNILSAGPSLLLLTSEDPKCRLKPLRRWLRKFALADRYNHHHHHNNNQSEAAAAASSPLLTSYPAWLHYALLSHTQHRLDNQVWARRCKLWSSQQQEHPQQAPSSSSTTQQQCKSANLKASSSSSNWSSHFCKDSSSCSFGREAAAASVCPKPTSANIETLFESHISQWERSVASWANLQLRVSCATDAVASAYDAVEQLLDDSIFLNLTQNNFMAQFNRSFHFVLVDGPGTQVMRARLGFSNASTAISNVLALIVDWKYENLFVLNRSVTFANLRDFINHYRHNQLSPHVSWSMKFPHLPLASSNHHTSHQGSPSSSSSTIQRRHLLHHPHPLCDSSRSLIPPQVNGSQLHDWLIAASTEAWRRQCRHGDHNGVIPASCCNLLVFYYTKHCGFCTTLWSRLLTAWRLLSTLPSRAHLQATTPFNVALVRLNLGENTLPWRLRVESVPALLLFPATSASQSVSFSFSHPLSVPRFVEFVLTHISNTIAS